MAGRSLATFFYIQFMIRGVIVEVNFVCVEYLGRVPLVDTILLCELWVSSVMIHVFVLIRVSSGLNSLLGVTDS